MSYASPCKPGPSSRASFLSLYPGDQCRLFPQELGGSQELQLASRRSESEDLEGVDFDVHCNSASESIDNEGCGKCESSEKMLKVKYMDVEAADPKISINAKNQSVAAANHNGTGREMMETIDSSDSEALKNSVKRYSRENDGRATLCRGHLDVASGNSLTETPVAWSAPYLNENFERSESVFQKFEEMMIPTAAEGSRRIRGFRPSPELVCQLGGEGGATAMVRIFSAIKDSLIAYSYSWLEGVVQDARYTPISKSKLLLCLQNTRIASAGPAVVHRVVLDLCVYKIVQNGMKKFKFEREHSELFDALSLAARSQMKASKHRFYLCAIFVARSFECVSLLRQTISSTSSLKKKLDSYLKIMSSLLSGIQQPRVDSSASKKRRVIRTPKIKMIARTSKQPEFGSLKRNSPKTSENPCIRNHVESGVAKGVYNVVTNSPFASADESHRVSFTDEQYVGGNFAPTRAPGKVELCLQDGTIIAQFESIRSASLATEMSYDRILERIDEGMLPRKPFFWRHSPLHAAPPDIFGSQRNADNLTKKAPRDEEPPPATNHAPPHPILPFQVQPEVGAARMRFEGIFSSEIAQRARDKRNRNASEDEELKPSHETCEPPADSVVLVDTSNEARPLDLDFETQKTPGSSHSLKCANIGTPSRAGSISSPNDGGVADTHKRARSKRTPRVEIEMADSGTVIVFNSIEEVSGSIPSDGLFEQLSRLKLRLPCRIGENIWRLIDDDTSVDSIT